MRIAQERSPTKEKLLETAQRLMLAKGFAATSLGDICEEAKLTKGSFFHYFKSKEQLGKEVLERFCRMMRERLKQAPFQAKRDPIDRLDGMLEFMIQMSKEPIAKQGCLLGSFSQELTQTHPEIRQCCAGQFQQWTEDFKRELDAVKSLYAPKTAIDTESLAQHYIAIVEGSLILAKAQQETSVVAENLRHFKRYLHSLFRQQS
jgi:TetR/AcrR family transcriptional repressor of nem operon